MDGSARELGQVILVQLVTTQISHQAVRQTMLLAYPKKSKNDRPQSTIATSLQMKLAYPNKSGLMIYTTAIMLEMIPRAWMPSGKVFT